jgi:hypothetical protein
VAVELEIIREVVGIPTQMQPDGAPSMDPILALGAARLTSEVIRALARVGEEIVVSFTTDGQVTATIATDGEARPPDVAQLNAAAAGLGGDLVVTPIQDGLEARLRLPARAG